MTFNSLFQDNWSNYFEFFSSLAYCTQFFSCYTQNRICLRNHPFVFFSSLFCLLLWHAIITNTKKDTREEYTLSKFKRVSCSSQNSFRLCSEIYIFFLRTDFLFFFLFELLSSSNNSFSGFQIVISIGFVLCIIAYSWSGANKVL